MRKFGLKSRKQLSSQGTGLLVVLKENCTPTYLEQALITFNNQVINKERSSVIAYHTLNATGREQQIPGERQAERAFNRRHHRLPPRQKYELELTFEGSDAGFGNFEKLVDTFIAGSIRWFIERGMGEAPTHYRGPRTLIPRRSDGGVAALRAVLIFESGQDCYMHWLKWNDYHWSGNTGSNVMVVKLHTTEFQAALQTHAPSRQALMDIHNPDFRAPQWQRLWRDVQAGLMLTD